MEKIEALSLFLDALDEWGCKDNDERAAVPRPSRYRR